MGRWAAGWRLRVGAALLALFTVGMVLAGFVLVAGDDARTVTVADGRVVDVGPSWPGGLDSCVTDAELDVLPNCYREPIDRGSFVKQPWSTASTFAFCAVGLVILAIADRERRSGTQPVNHLTSLGFVALAMGPGSALYHGTLTSWGGFFDQMSMYALLSFVVACDAARLRGRPDRFTPWFWGSLAVATLLKVVSGEAGTLVFITVAVGVGVFALVAWLRLPERARVRRDGRRLAVAFTVLGAAIVPWVLSNPGAGNPTDVPYHSAWHVLSAVFVAAYWWYLRSEVASGPSRTGDGARDVRARG